MQSESFIPGKDASLESSISTLNESGVTDERLVAASIGLAPGDDAFWSDLRVGELKTLLALAVGDEDAIAEGCEWVRHFDQVNAERRRVYRCVECLMKLDDDTRYAPAMESLYGAQTLRQANALLDGELRFFDQPSLGLKLADCDMHQRLLAGYAKLHRN